MRRSYRPIYLAGLAVALAVALPMAAASAADSGADEQSLCDHITVEDLHELSSLRFSDPLSGSSFGGDYCAFGGTPTDAGQYEITVSVFDVLGLDDLRMSAPGGEDVVVAGNPAYILDQPDYVPPAVQLSVELGDEVLTVLAAVTDEAPDVDRNGFATAIAEIVAGRLAEATASNALPVPAAETGISLDVRREATGEDVSGRTDADSFAPWAALLEATGGDVSQLRQVDANVLMDGSDQPVGQYTSLTVPGADPDTMRTGVLEFFQLGFEGEEVVVDDVTIAGVPLVALGARGETFYMYLEGDTAHILAIPEDIAATLLEQLP